MNITTTGGQESSGYILNGSTVVPLGSKLLPPPHERSSAKKIRRRIRSRFGLLFLAPVLIGAVIALIALAATPSVRDVEIASTSAIVSIGDEDIAIITYDDTSRPGLFEPMFQIRASAIRLSDGEQLWDQRLNEDLAGDAVVLAGDSRWIYIGTGHGLVILDAGSGAIEHQGTGISGLGADAVLAASAYGYDAEANAIVLLSGTGQILQMSVGEKVAAPAAASLAARWTSTLSASALYDDVPLERQVDEAIGPDGAHYAIESVAEAVQRDALVITPASGAGVRGAELVDASILPEVDAAARVDVLLATEQLIDGLATGSEVDQDAIEELMRQMAEGNGGVVPEPAGLAEGYLLVQHRASINAEGMQVSSIDAATGQVVATADMGADALRALVGASGTTAVIAAAPDSWFPNQLLVLQSDGTFRTVAVGSIPWWLTPFG